MRLSKHETDPLSWMMQLVERGNTWAHLCGAEGQVQFAMANATVSLAHMLSGPNPYPGPVSMVTIQFPGKCTHISIHIMYGILLTRIQRCERLHGYCF